MVYEDILVIVWIIIAVVGIFLASVAIGDSFRVYRIILQENINHIKEYAAQNSVIISGFMLLTHLTVFISGLIALVAPPDRIEIPTLVGIVIIASMLTSFSAYIVYRKEKLVSLLLGETHE